MEHTAGMATLRARRAAPVHPDAAPLPMTVSPCDRIRFQSPEMPPFEAIEAYFRRSRDAAWFSNAGPCHELLRERIGDYLGGLRCVPTGNATLALMLALRALLGPPRPGALVVVPSFTFVATVDAILWCGFEPLFADVDPESWHLAPEALDGALASRADQVAGVLACSAFGTAPPSRRPSAGVTPPAAPGSR